MAEELTDSKATERLTGFWLHMSVLKEFFVTEYKTENNSG